MSLLQSIHYVSSACRRMACAHPHHYCSKCGSLISDQVQHCRQQLVRQNTRGVAIVFSIHEPTTGNTLSYVIQCERCLRTMSVNLLLMYAVSATAMVIRAR
jgi:hypothetical protein